VRIGSLLAIWVPATASVPTLVIHGTVDPMFPLEHGQALAKEIPGARLLPLEGSGHGVERADWETIVRAVLAHTAGRASR
jgi:pimeloyl-ACP methyl ester carboxylesterase